MKLISEFPLNSCDDKTSLFTWVPNNSNWLFIIEDGKRMRTINIDQESSSELQAATLADNKTCTSLSWNKDGALLALVVDKRQVYFWEVKINSFLHFKSHIKMSDGHNLASKKETLREIELVAWSKVSNTLAICYSTGQIHLCNYGKDIQEKLIDNSMGVLSQISSMESCDHLDIFVCVTVIYEVLVMSFDGLTRFYIQADSYAVCLTKFSMPSEVTESRKLSDESAAVHLWLVYLNAGNNLLFKKIEFGTKSIENPKTEIRFASDDEETAIVDVHWLNRSSLVVCMSSGKVLLLNIREVVDDEGTVGYLVCKEDALDLSADLNDKEDTFISFALAESSKLSKNHRMASKLGQTKIPKVTKSYSVAAMTSHKLIYLELLGNNSNESFAFERVDELDLSSGLKKMNLRLERAEWSVDSSRLAIQLSNNHILVYRTKLDEYMVASYRSKVAYLSSANEITILDYGDAGSNSEVEVEEGGSSSNNALTMTVGLKPSVISIGERHLAVALNNRVRFYQIVQSIVSTKGRAELADQATFVEDREYVSVVIGLSLSSHYAAIHFNDRRLKLHAIRTKVQQTNGELSPSSGEDDSLNERFFPDPNNKNENIVVFTLTEQLFVYCTSQLQLVVFDVARWTTVQTCDHSRSSLTRPIGQLRPNDVGNKIVCLAEPCDATFNVLLYDLFSNTMVSFTPNELHSQMLASQLLCRPSLVTEAKTRLELADWQPERAPWPNLDRIEDAIWDKDGRTLLLFEHNSVHGFVVMDHVLASEETTLMHVGSTAKQSSYTALYASQGIVSYQTALGRVVNLILQSHDDEHRLAELERKIKLVSGNCETSRQLNALKLKLEFMRSILPIYSLGRCRDICEHLMTDESFNSEANKRVVDIELVLWRQLAAWALFTCNLRFAQSVYQAHMMPVEARVLGEILADCRSKNLDLKGSVKTRILVLLGCDLDIA